MKDNLRDYIDNLFEDAPHTKKTVELKEEMLQNLEEKYEDLLAQGKGEEAAYNLAVASVGDIGELISYLHSDVREEAGYTREELLRNRRRSALLVSIAVGMYILCPVAFLLFEELFDHRLLGIVSFFLMIAVATGLLVYNGMTRLRYQKTEDTVVEEFKEWKAAATRSRQTFRSISAAISALTLAIYFLISFLTGAWYITWIIFLISGAVQAVIKAVFDLKG